jgi:hypothetical protein
MSKTIYNESMIEDYSEYKLDICNLVSKSQIVDDCIYNNNYFNTFFTAKNTKKLDCVGRGRG